jgi:hypothetical protein
MLGWEMHIINKATGQEYGDWLAGLGATKWIDKLVADGKAEKFYTVACSHYTIKAKDLIPEVIKLEKCSNKGVTEDGWISDFVMNIAELKQCADDDLVIVQTYDAS